MNNFVDKSMQTTHDQRGLPMFINTLPVPPRDANKTVSVLGASQPTVSIETEDLPEIVIKHPPTLHLFQLKTSTRIKTK